MLRQQSAEGEVLKQPAIETIALQLLEVGDVIIVEVAPPTASDLNTEVCQDSLAVITEGPLIQRRAGIIG